MSKNCSTNLSIHSRVTAISHCARGASDALDNHVIVNRKIMDVECPLLPLRRELENAQIPLLLLITTCHRPEHLGKHGPGSHIRTTCWDRC